MSDALISEECARSVLSQKVQGLRGGNVFIGANKTKDRKKKEEGRKWNNGPQEKVFLPLIRCLVSTNKPMLLFGITFVLLDPMTEWAP